MRRSMAKMAGGLAGVAIMGSALGAELSEEARPDLSPWAGPYAGLSIGAQSADNRWQTTSIAPAVGSNAFVPSAGTSGDMDSTAMAVGGYLGINWRLAPTWVAGVEADFNGGDHKKTANPLPGTSGTFFGTPSVGLPGGSVKETWNASLRLRLGYLLSPTTLIYGTGGVAWQRLELSAHCTIVPGNSFCFGTNHNETHASTRTGWTLGGGVEHKIDRHWGIRFDYRYADFGTWTRDFFVSGGVGPGFDDRFTAKVTTHTQTTMVSLAYQF